MTKFLPTYNQCREICDTHDNFLFYEAKYVIDGYNVSVFNYRLAYITHFETPIEGKPYKANEMRGLTFIFNKDGSLYNRFLLLDKFWNINQTEMSSYDAIKDLPVKSVYYKEDGSVVSFVKFPNGNILAKSKTSFETEMALASMDIYNKNSELKRFVNDMLDNDITPIFEYVSPYNRIVLEYDYTDLVLLRLRNNTTGEYLSIDDLPYDIRITGKVDLTLDQVMELSKTVTGIEGWVLDVGFLVKEKTQWYRDRHGLFTESLNQENYIIKLILEDSIDDIMAMVKDDEKQKEVDVIVNKVNNYIHKKVIEINKLISDNYNGDIKDFAIKTPNSPEKSLAFNVIIGKDIIELVKDHLMKKTNRLMLAREWIAKN